jgi:hypothetical protein
MFTALKRGEYVVNVGRIGEHTERSLLRLVCGEVLGVMGYDRES